MGQASPSRLHATPAAARAGGVCGAAFERAVECTRIRHGLTVRGSTASARWLFSLCLECECEEYEQQFTMYEEYGTVDYTAMKDVSSRAVLHTTAVRVGQGRAASTYGCEGCVLSSAPAGMQETSVLTCV